MSQTPPFDLLTRAQQIALVSLVSGNSTRRASGLAEATERTVRRWRKQPFFRAALAEARVDFFSACRSHVNASRAAAFEILTAVAGYGGHKREQMQAATFLLDRVLHPQKSAKSGREAAKFNKMNRLRQRRRGPQRTSADLNGLQRTPAAVERTPAVAGGRPTDLWRTSEHAS